MWLKVQENEYSSHRLALELQEKNGQCKRAYLASSVLQEVQQREGVLMWLEVQESRSIVACKHAYVARSTRKLGMLAWGRKTSRLHYKFLCLAGSA